MDKIREYAFFNQLVTLSTLKELADPLVDYLSRTFNSQTVTLILFKKDGPPSPVVTHVPDTDLRAHFNTHYARIGYILDPFYTKAFDEAEYTAYQLREISPDRFETSEYYQRYYAATTMVDELGATIRTDPDTALHLSMGRTKGNGRFRGGDLRYFRLLAPILMNKLLAISPQPADLSSAQNAPGLIERYRNLRVAGQTALSLREAEIAALIVQGHSSRAAGLKLGISDQTVKVHRRNIYKKLQISSQNELFSFLVQDMRGA
ncbi:helix-turn-helix transcriptional regulator [Rhodobacteraceae bacterium KMM 6894]|nr:helix-turn-helix transcriptional regulator [Rhodobacteraceae bacterium KMM 6894]